MDGLATIFPSPRTAAAPPGPSQPEDERIRATRQRIASERRRVRRCLDDIRHGLSQPIKRRHDRPVLYRISDVHSAYLVKSATGWLPLAWRAYRAAQSDLRFLEQLLRPNVTRAPLAAAE